MENWKDIKGYENLYQISDFGNVKSIEKKSNGTRGRINIRHSINHKPFLTKKGYNTVKLRKNGHSKSFLVHRLVAINFIPNIHNKSQVNHINSIKTDNSVTNLEWCTASENLIHSFKNGTHNIKGEKNPSSKITNNDAEDIRKSNESIKELSKKYKISEVSVRKVKLYKSFVNI